jgi:hypothetical protein
MKLSNFADQLEVLGEHVEKVNGKWALVSKHTGRVLRYYHGEGRPSKEWVSKMEQQIHSFESVNEGFDPNARFSIPTTADGDWYSVYSNGSAENEHTGETYSKIVFVPGNYGNILQSLDGMVKHFGGVNKIGIKPNSDQTFSFFLVETGKDIQGVKNGKQEPFSIPYKPEPYKGCLVFVFSADNNGRLSKYKFAGYANQPVGGKYAKDHPNYDAKNNWSRT